MSVRVSGFLAQLAAVLVCVVTASGAAQTAGEDVRSQARQAFDAGTAAFARGDYGAAHTQFKVANDLIATPHALYWIAASLDKLEQTDAAIRAYEQLLEHPDLAAVGPDRIRTASERLAALKTPKPPEPSAAAAGPPAPVDPPAAFAPPPQREPKLSWKRNLFELGVITGPLFLGSKHNLAEHDAPDADYTLAWLLGARVGYYPIRFVGFELDGAHGWGRVKGDALPGQDAGAQFNLARGFVVGQYPVGRFVPFALVGAGVIHADSDRLGEDIDFMLSGGAGAKVAVSKVFTPRLDFHLNLTQKRGGGFSEGIAFHPSLLLGIDFTLGR
jgi:hypothetical protein